MESNYIQTNLTTIVNIHKIISIRYYEFDKDFVFSGESHDFWEMVYVDSGEVEINAGERRLYLKQGEIIFHEPNEFHTIRPFNKAANVFVMSFISKSKAMDFFRKKNFLLPSPLRRNIALIIDEHFRTFKPMLFDDNRLELLETPIIGGQQMIKSYLEQLLIMIIRREQKPHESRMFLSKEGMESYLTSCVMDLIDNSIYKKISVEDICKKLNYSKTYLSKIFKEATGHTILEYIIRKKIKEAKLLIREQKYSFTEISDMLCFDNPHYFSTVFKRITNMTPTKYKTSVKI